MAERSAAPDNIVVTDSDLPAGLDADQLIFDIGGIMMALNNSLQLHRDDRASGRARVAIDRLLSGR